MATATAGLLSRQLKNMQTQSDIPGISAGLVDDNIFEWDVMIMMSDECRFYGGGWLSLLNSTEGRRRQCMLDPLDPRTRARWSVSENRCRAWVMKETDIRWLANARSSTGGFFRARMSFPPEYPLLPPKMKFETPIFHPNGTPVPSPTTHPSILIHYDPTSIHTHTHTHTILIPQS